MQNDREFSRPARRLEALMSRRLGLSRGTLATRVARSRKMLPDTVRQDLMVVAEAEHFAGHPRLAPQINRKAVRSSYKRAAGYLRGPEVDDLRRGQWLGVAGSLMANLLILFVMIFLLLWWQNLL